MAGHSERTATGSALGDRVRVTVDADGIVIDTHIELGGELVDYDTLAQALTEAAQNAQAALKLQAAPHR
ncbi:MULTISPECIES: YbaB/EbfC family nucleoid-associated protein [Nocardia]|uniref:YbaB/EbfC family nucleoid-associated protein n=1 Tax=Nocardia iowensis TaxID=204891 RepID=A0ABX8RVQ1_NOCIO|nr:YbaB/EbfC family nucleoid-associated protein [Nocardia iowensis]QXN92490.1 YbaB/EbfC family nucleoid-associated protein [Nocardia iowensis]